MGWFLFWSAVVLGMAAYLGGGAARGARLLAGYAWWSGFLLMGAIWYAWSHWHQVAVG
jgi:hypothetical protein